MTTRTFTTLAAGWLLLAAAGPGHDDRSLEVLDRLHRTRVSVEFRETPARDVFRILQRLTDVNIVGRYLDDRRGGLDPSTPITLGVSDRPAIEVLEAVLDQSHGLFEDDPCTWQLRRGYVEVGTKSRLEAHVVVRMYDVNDVALFVPRFDNAPGLDLDAALSQATSAGGGQGGQGALGGGGSIIGTPDAEPDRTPEQELGLQLVELIRATIEPDLWIDDRMTVRYRQGVLIVRAPDYVQRQIGGYPAWRAVRSAPGPAPADRAGSAGR